MREQTRHGQRTGEQIGRLRQSPRFHSAPKNAYSGAMILVSGAAADSSPNQWPLTLKNRNSFLLLKPTNLKKMTLSISKLMTTSARFIGLRGLWPLATTSRALMLTRCVTQAYSANPSKGTREFVPPSHGEQGDCALV